jgi:hypothetical protein
MAVSGSRTGAVTDEPLSGDPGELGSAPGGGGFAGGAPGGGGSVVVVRGERMMKHAGPAFRWLAWAAVGLRVVLA